MYVIPHTNNAMKHNMLLGKWNCNRNISKLYELRRNATLCFRLYINKQCELRRNDCCTKIKCVSLLKAFQVKIDFICRILYRKLISLHNERKRDGVSNPLPQASYYFKKIR